MDMWVYFEKGNRVHGLEKCRELDPVSSVIMKGRLTWFEHVECKKVTAVMSIINEYTDSNKSATILDRNKHMNEITADYRHLWHWKTFSPQFPHTPGFAGTDALHRGHCRVSADAWTLS